MAMTATPVSTISMLMVSMVMMLLNGGLIDAAIPPSSNPIRASPVEIQLVRDEVNTMRSRWQVLDSNCSTNAIFSLTYLYMTNALLDTVSSGYFDDNPAMANFTRDFARRYNIAIDPYMAATTSGGATGSTSGIPAPWLEAFTYGESGYSSVQEDLVLGMSAHINYDLSAVIYALNYGYPRYKTDYDRINDILTSMAGPVNNDLGLRYDPQFLNPSNSALSPAVLQMLFTWRETAWQNGVAQLTAPDPITREALKATVLAEAMAIAQTQKSYNGGTSTRATRLAYCQANHAPSRV